MTKSLEDELAESLAEEMRKTIDFDILCDIRARSGWGVVITEHTGGQEWIDCVRWAKENCLGDYREHNGKWLFERPEEATMFALRWA